LTRAREDLVRTRVGLANPLRDQLPCFWPGGEQGRGRCELAATYADRGSCNLPRRAPNSTPGSLWSFRRRSSGRSPVATFRSHGSSSISAPSLRLTCVPPTRHFPHHVSTPAASVRTISAPVPEERLGFSDHASSAVTAEHVVIAEIGSSWVANEVRTSAAYPPQTTVKAGKS
jgi:hypothetical protein